MLKHIWIIMDGNRRWAKKKFLPTLAWHTAWAKNIQTTVEYALKNNISTLTLWALSTENLTKRNTKEVEGIISLLNDAEKYLGGLIKNKIRFETIGDISRLPEKSQEILKNLKQKTEKNSTLTVVVALVYWGQDEIIRGIKKVLGNFLPSWPHPLSFEGEGSKKLKEFLDKLTQENFREYLDTGKYSPPDLIIRTGGDTRHSGFLLYDSAYSEYYFTETLWPDFDKKEFAKAVKFYTKSKRNFGK